MDKIFYFLFRKNSRFYIDWTELEDEILKKNIDVGKSNYEVIYNG